MSHELDQIRIKDLKLRCIIGINPEERVKKQDVVINLTLYADLMNACQSDRIEDTVNYKKIKLAVVDMVENSSFNLIERLAQAVADLALEESMVQKVKVRLDKPGALRFAKTVGVEILRIKK